MTAPTPHEQLREAVAAAEAVDAATIAVPLWASRELLAEHDDATRTRTLGGPVTGTRVPTRPA